MLPSQLGPTLHLKHPFLPSSDLQNRARLTATPDNPGWFRSQPLKVGQKSSAADIIAPFSDTSHAAEFLSRS
jgi:hypothetical protein